MKTKINKQKAKRLFNEGQDVYIIPCKMNLYSIWGGLMKTNKKEGKWEWFINNAIYYNCDSERGKYLHYYID